MNEIHKKISSLNSNNQQSLNMKSLNVEETSWNNLI